MCLCLISQSNALPLYNQTLLLTEFFLNETVCIIQTFIRFNFALNSSIFRISFSS